MRKAENSLRRKARKSVGRGHFSSRGKNTKSFFMAGFVTCHQGLESNAHGLIGLAIVQRPPSPHVLKLVTSPSINSLLRSLNALWPCRIQRPLGPYAESRREDATQDLQFASWVPVQGGIIMIHEDDLYFQPHAEESRIVRITRSGVPGLVYNGIPNPAYRGSLKCLI